MTHPTDQTPTPGTSYYPAYPPMSPPPWMPPPPKGFWSSARGVLLIIVMVGGLAIAAATVFVAFSSPGSSVADDLTAQVTSCEFTGGGLPAAEVGFTVTNTGTRTRTATLTIEYRDSAGNRIDTETTTVRNIAPGDTVRSSEITFLDAAASSGACGITGIR
jgi:hypothetical protein